jgi:hypothetical protein
LRHLGIQRLNAGDGGFGIGGVGRGVRRIQAAKFRCDGRQPDLRIGRIEPGVGISAVMAVAMVMLCRRGFFMPMVMCGFCGFFVPVPVVVILGGCLFLGGMVVAMVMVVCGCLSLPGRGASDAGSATRAGDLAGRASRAGAYDVLAAAGRRRVREPAPGGLSRAGFSGGERAGASNPRLNAFAACMHPGRSMRRSF